MHSDSRVKGVLGGSDGILYLCVFACVLKVFNNMHLHANQIVPTQHLASYPSGEYMEGLIAHALDLWKL